MTCGVKSPVSRRYTQVENKNRLVNGRRSSLRADEFDASQSVTLQALDRRLAEIHGANKSTENTKL